MIVLDSSAAVHLIVAPSVKPALAERVLDRPLRAPHLMDVEVASALRGLLRGRRVSVERAEWARERYLRFPVTRYGHALLLGRMWELRGQLTAYDACYVALAEALQIPLVTTDARLARSKGHSAEVELY